MSAVNQRTGEGSACDRADECVLDPECPFHAGNCELLGDYDINERHAENLFLWEENHKEEQ